MTGGDVWVNLLVQVPLVGIFVWFTLQQQKIFQISQEKRDGEWRDFLSEMRDANNKALARIAEEVKAAAVITSAVKELMFLHDQRVQAAIPDMQVAVSERKPRQRKEP